ncbi:hypothetical protein ACFVVU_10540 [Kitasatospora sp. NPDC057965]|uniref:hypothetical protein n=1 Tax=Kitasatospora sp. NPDC057965 TaxID=3346291 RepID=UPI0036DAD1FE
MLPPAGAVDAVVSAPDSFDVPVFVRRSAPLEPVERPKPVTVAQVKEPWPSPGAVPPDGAYLVTTTWRDLLDAATTVGRDIAPWLAAVPRLARREIMARRHPLGAYLVRQRTKSPAPGGAGTEIVPSVVYTHGTEGSMRSAFGYHVGMTMAEWACRSLMGLGPTTHAESAAPPGAVPKWKTTRSLPDLFGTHPSSAELWLVEAKGGRWLPDRSRRKGARQLDVGALMTEPYRKVLCGTSLEKRLFMMIDVEDGPSAPDGPLTGAAADLDEDLVQDDDEALLDLAQARMLTYLALVSLPREGLRAVAVGGPRPGPARRRSGLVTLLEGDEGTAALRRELGAGATVNAIGRRQGVDMLVGRLPGTDLMLGMSRRLFGACRELAWEDRRLASVVDEVLPTVRQAAGWGTEARSERRTRERAEALQEGRDREGGIRRGAVRRGFSRGRAESWAQLADVSPRVVVPAAEGFLEAATRDTYLAVEEHALDLDLDLDLDLG